MPNAVPQPLSAGVDTSCRTSVAGGGGDSPGGLTLIAGSLLECEYRLGREVDGGDWPSLKGGSSGKLAAFEAGSVAASRAKTPATSVLSSKSVVGKESYQDSIRRIEHSFLWQTSGKGERDFAIHYFEQRQAPMGGDVAADPLGWCFRPCVFRTVCPLTPLSYRGHLLAIDWLVRVRVFLLSGQQLTFEQEVCLVPA
jgi:hypothetical protein